MRRIMLILMVCALVLLCFSATAYAKSAKPADVPFTATMSGVVTFTDGGGYGLPPNPNPPYLWTVSNVDGSIGTDPIHMF
ncbi:MAG: hypothetical protein ABH877_04065, partial [bacterium]